MNKFSNLITRTGSKKDDSQEAKVDPEQQLDFGLSEPFSNKVKANVSKFKLQLEKLETKRFVKELHTWFLILSSVGLIFTQFRMIRQLYKILPSPLPLMQYFLDLESKLVDKRFLYVVPALSAAVLVASAFTSYSVFNKNKVLGNFTLITMFFSIITITIALAKLLSNYNG